MTFLKNSLYTLFTRSSQVASALIIGIVLAQTLGKVGNGTYELFQLLITFSVTLGALGVGHASVYIVKNSRQGVQKTLSTVFVFGVTWGVVLAIIVYFFYSTFDNLTNGLPENTLLFGVLIIPFALLESYLIQSFLINLQIKKQALLALIKNTTLILLLFVLIVLLGLGIQGIIISIAITYLLSSVITLIMVRRTFHITFSFDRSIFVKLLSFGVRAWIANIFLILNYRVDMYIINYYLDVDAVGLYSVAATIAMGIFLIPAAVGPLLYSRWSGMNVNNYENEVPRISRQLLLISIIMGMLVAITGHGIITFLYGNAFIPSYTALVLLLPGVIFMTVNYVLFNSLAARGSPGLNAIALLIGLIGNVGLNIFLIPSFGINGAAIASTFSYTLTTFITIIFFINKHKNITSRNFIFPTLSDTLMIKDQIIKLMRKEKV